MLKAIKELGKYIRKNKKLDVVQVLIASKLANIEIAHKIDQKK